MIANFVEDCAESVQQPVVTLVIDETNMREHKSSRYLRAEDSRNERSPGKVAIDPARTVLDLLVESFGSRAGSARCSSIRPRQDRHDDERSHEQDVEYHQDPAKESRTITLE